MVRNEADVIESFVRHNLCWADCLYVTVHQSTDETLAILEKLRDEGLPLVLSEVEGVAQKQSEVITALAYRAAEEGAELLVPLDADEFLVPDAWPASYGDCRRACRTALEALSSEKAYALAWRRYVPGKGAGFLLYRPARREKEPEQMRKAAVGAGLLQSVSLTISQGNHRVLLTDTLSETEGGARQEPRALIGEPVPGVHIAHYPWRSTEQAETKVAVGWLANVAKYSRYTRLANHWRDGFRDLMSGRPVQPEPLRQPEKVPRWPQARELQLRYTPGKSKGGVLGKVLQAAEALAEECCERQVLQAGPLVSLVMEFVGRTKLFRETLESAVADPYPCKEYIVYTRTKDEDLLEELEQILAGQPVERIVFLTGSEIVQLPGAVQGEYVQWLPEGYRIARGRLTKLTTSLATQPELALQITATEQGKALASLLRQGKVFDVDTAGRVFLSADGNQAARAIGDSRQSFAGGLAACFCRRSVLEQQGVLDILHDCRDNGSSLLPRLLSGVVYGYVAEPLLAITEV